MRADLAAGGDRLGGVAGRAAEARGQEPERARVAAGLADAALAIALRAEGDRARRGIDGRVGWPGGRRLGVHRRWASSALAPRDLDGSDLHGLRLGGELDELDVDSGTAGRAGVGLEAADPRG